MHPLIATFIILCNMFLLVAIVSSQPQPLTSPSPRQRPPGGGLHGPSRGHHRQGKGRNFSGGGTTPISRPVTTTSNQNQHQNQNQNPTTPSQIKSGGDLNQPQENNTNPGSLFGWAPKNKTTSSDDRILLADEFLHAHNWVRSKYNLPPYTWDEKLESFARKYLMERYNDCLMIHSNSSYGENLFWGKRLHWTPSDAVYFWYMEKVLYDFKTLKCSPPPPDSPPSAPKTCGHFTQIVWRDSLRLGCALQHCKDRGAGMLVACEYDPPGNYVNENPLEHHR